MGPAYDNWRFTNDNCTEAEFYPGPSHKQVADKLADLDREIEWNIRRLGTLVMSDEDREQTEDLVEELRGERQSLAGCFNAG